MSDDALPQQEAYVNELRQMQGDALLLLKFVSGRFDKVVAPKAPNIAPCTGTVGAETERDVFLRDLSSILATPAEALARDPKRSGFLFGAIDYLTCLSRPATIDTIKFTRAYMDVKRSVSESSAPNEQVVREKARSFRRIMRIFYAGCAAILFAVLMMMAHVVSGQRIMANLTAERLEQSHVWDMIDAASASAAVPPAKGNEGSTGNTNVSMVRLCADGEEKKGQQKEGGSIATLYNPLSPKICGKLNDINMKLALTYQQLGVWNGATDNFYYIFPIPTWLRPQIVLPTPSERPPVLDKHNWEQTEQRTEIMLLGMANYGIPVLLGLLGAMVYAFRVINSRIEMCALGDRDVYQASMRIVLGIILGGLVSMVFDFSGVELSGVKLSLWAIAFLVGYAVQIVFETLDRLVALGAGRVPRRGAGEPANVPMPARLQGPVQPAE